jgi:hypothetical protein
MPTTKEKEDLVASVQCWTRKERKDGKLPSITWEQIVDFHSGFSCVDNIKKYLDSPSQLTVWYNSCKMNDSLIYRVMVPYFWKKGSKHPVYISYQDPDHPWALCDCVRRFVFYHLKLTRFF